VELELYEALKLLDTDDRPCPVVPVAPDSDDDQPSGKVHRPALLYRRRSSSPEHDLTGARTHELIDCEIEVHGNTFQESCTIADEVISLLDGNTLAMSGDDITFNEHAGYEFGLNNRYVNQENVVNIHLWFNVFHIV